MPTTNVCMCVCLREGNNNNILLSNKPRNLKLNIKKFNHYNIPIIKRKEEVIVTQARICHTIVVICI